MPALGHIIQSDGGYRASWNFTQYKNWQSFFASAGSRRARGVKSNLCVNLMNRMVTPVLRFRFVCWPMGKFLLEEMGSTQKRMVACCLKIPRRPSEDSASYIRKKCREAAAHIRDEQKWSRICIKAQFGWSDHLERDRNAACWPAILKKCQSADWFDIRPTHLVHLSAGGGATQTRNVIARPARRWDEGLRWAKN